MDTAPATSPPTSSRVTIECTDPSNILETVQERLADYLPLKNLHWKSPTRPLRSIPALNCSFVRKETTNGPHSNARRHQIPGLRETPYVKLYLLRCDDKELYKETVRKELKQWIKDNTLEKESKKALRNQEHHDAYEWMIVHVVFPGTTAAAQPRSSKHISLETTDSTESVNSKSKWTGKSSSTIYDKLRADFSSSKAAVPHVVQVRISEAGKPQTALSPTEIEEQWQEFVDNLKQCILKSFNTRVLEYEEDIKERENQRSLPGWNFCTFFILKEGLARGFENVGLLDDSLAVYSELQLGLDEILKEQGRVDADAPGALLPYSKELKTTIRNALIEEDPDVRIDESTDPSGLAQILAMDNDKYPLDVEKKSYRDLILSNNVSGSDLRIYMFTRKLEIKLRQASLPPPGTTPSQLKQTHLDMIVMAEIAEGSLDFINRVSRDLRADLHSAWGGRLSGKERALQKIIISNIVSSWTWTAVTQVLALILPATGLSHHQLEVGLDKFPQDSAIQLNGHNTERPASKGRDQSSSRSVSSSRRSHETNTNRSSYQLRPGYTSLLAWVARLILLARTTAEELPAAMKWTNSLENTHIQGPQMFNKKLYRISSHIRKPSMVNGTIDHLPDYGDRENVLRSLDATALRYVARDEDSFHDMYATLSKSALHLLQLAQSAHAVNQVLIDLARLAFKNDDKALASRYLGQVFAHDPSTGSVYEYALAIYAECLKELDQPNEYARCLLMLLQSAAESIRMKQQYCEELIQIADAVDPVQLPLGSIVTVREVDKIISPRTGCSGFFLSVAFQTPHSSHILLQGQSRLILRSLTEQEPAELILKGPQILDLTSGSCSAPFVTGISTSGWYSAQRLEVDIGKMHFVHHFDSNARDGEDGYTSRHRSQTPSVLTYTASDVPWLEVSASNNVILGQLRSVKLSLLRQSSNLRRASIRLRPATAGLRLLVHDSRLAASADPDVSLGISRVNDVSVITLDGLDVKGQVDLDVPFTLEHASEPTITIKTEMTYSENGEEFDVFKVVEIDVLIPVSVNLQDIHRSSYCFSRFLISPSTLVPILLHDCSLDETSNIDVLTPDKFEAPFVVFPQQPAHWMAQLKYKAEIQAHQKSRLMFNVKYQSLDNLILGSVKNTFREAWPDGDDSPYLTTLTDHLLQRIKNDWTEQDLEVAGMTRTVEMWKMNDIAWKSILCAFDKETSSRIGQRLSKWHEQCQSIPIDFTQAPVRYLRLSVDLPARPPIVTTFLTMNEPIRSATVSVDQPILCNLVIDIALTQDLPAECEFMFELLVQSETWLVGGRKKGSIPPMAGTTSIPVVLFAQRLGSLLLPVVDFRCRQRDASNPKAVGGWIALPVEVHNKTISKTITVTPNLRSTTVAIVGEEGQQNEPVVLVDSQKYDNTGETKDAG